MNEKKVQQIMVIDDNITNLKIARQALESQYEVLLISSGEKAIKLLERVTPDLILLDVDMPGMNGFEVIKFIKQQVSTLKDVPVIFLTALTDNSSEYDGLSLGAVDYITKPFSFSLLLKRIEMHLQLYSYNHKLEKIVEEKTKIISSLQFSIVRVMSDMVERRDGSTGRHLIRTQCYLKVLLDEVKKQSIYKSQLCAINEDLFINASQLHDIGKISIPDRILLKPSKLSPEEFAIMKTHTVLGEEAIRKAMTGVQQTEFLEIAAAFASSHHERWDGTGYPKALSGEQIPIEGRLMAIADVYDALVSARPYKHPMTHAAAKDVIIKECGKHFDPLLVAAFEQVSPAFELIAKNNTDPKEVAL